MEPFSRILRLQALGRNAIKNDVQYRRFPVDFENIFHRNYSAERL